MPQVEATACARPRRASRGVSGASASDGPGRVGGAAAWFALRPFPGYSSRPAAAGPDAGALIAAHIERGFLEAALATFDGRIPDGEWLIRVAGRLSFGGRLE